MPSNYGKTCRNFDALQILIIFTDFLLNYSLYIYVNYYINLITCAYFNDNKFINEILREGPKLHSSAILMFTIFSNYAVDLLIIPRGIIILSFTN